MKSSIYLKIAFAIISLPVPHVGAIVRSDDDYILILTTLDLYPARQASPSQFPSPILLLVPPGSTQQNLLRGRELVTANKQYFEPAISLQDFKNVDTDRFEWVDPSEIKAGETTCGFLKAPLGWEVDELDIVYPTVHTYICVMFGSKQPATRGNLAVHCGGPGSLSLCIYTIWLTLDEETRATYNLIGLDQRGMGRSNPTFVVDECAAYLSNKKLYPYVDYTDEEDVRIAAKEYKRIHMNCWNYPGFHMEAEQDDGTQRKFHFLEYSGSRQAAEDIERVRHLFGDQKLSIYGVSYGTVVMGTYATVFSDNVNLMVLDGSVDPSSDIALRTMAEARSYEQRLDYFFASCEFGNTQCPVSDLRTCINDVDHMIDSTGEEFEIWLEPLAANMELIGFKANKSSFMLLVLEMMFANFAEMIPLCDAAENNDAVAFKDWVVKNIVGGTGEELMGPVLPSPQNGIANVTVGNTTHFFHFNTASKPTSWMHADPYWPFMGYHAIGGRRSSSVCQDMITAQDMSFGAYDEDRYVDFMQRLNEEYPGAGTGLPAKFSQQWYSATYYWPNITPLSPIGNSFVKGIIAGQIYDPWAPYVWTQKMRDNFKSTNLLTSRSVNHGMKNSMESFIKDKRCNGNILRYFKNGYVDFNDGKVCESAHIGDSCTLRDIMMNAQCKGVPTKGERRSAAHDRKESQGRSNPKSDGNCLDFKKGMLGAMFAVLLVNRRNLLM